MARIKDQIIEGKNHEKVESQTLEELKSCKNEQQTLMQMFTRQNERLNKKKIQKQNNTETKIEQQQQIAIKKKRTLAHTIQGLPT